MKKSQLRKIIRESIRENTENTPFLKPDGTCVNCEGIPGYKEWASKGVSLNDTLKEHFDPGPSFPWGQGSFPIPTYTIKKKHCSGVCCVTYGAAVVLNHTDLWPYNFINSVTPTIGMPLQQISTANPGGAASGTGWVSGKIHSITPVTHSGGADLTMFSPEDCDFGWGCREGKQLGVYGCYPGVNWNVLPHATQYDCEQANYAIPDGCGAGTPCNKCCCDNDGQGGCVPGTEIYLTQNTNPCVCPTGKIECGGKPPMGPAKMADPEIIKLQQRAGIKK